ncbi:MAG: hypothetical protein HYX40_03530 [Sphingobacteriales bacterium]|nr:hypothetical protein [Sphingobacteriales bacterium]
MQSFSQNNTVKKEEATYTVEYYYKVKWGFADEFIGLFKKNHLPILKKQMQLGRILSLKAETPVYHGTEDGRWDYRVTITWKSAATTFDGFDEDAIKKELYPDEATFKKEEQRRFEILLAHWDLPVKPVEINN